MVTTITCDHRCLPPSVGIWQAGLGSESDVHLISYGYRYYTGYNLCEMGYSGENKQKEMKEWLSNFLENI
jgi:hypothetical protein